MKRLLLLTLFITTAIFAQQAVNKVAGGFGEVYMAPVYSPDGSMLAFSSTNYKGIWIYRFSDETLIQVTDEAAAGFGFSWSQDSKNILSRVAEYEGMKRLNAVKIFDVKSGESKNLSGYTSSMPVIPQWTNGDSKVVTFLKSRTEYSTGKTAKAGSNLRSAFSLGSKIILGDSQTALEPIKGAELLNLRLSPDGSKIVFEVMGGNIHVINYDGSGLRDIGKGNRPMWSPDSKSLVYMVTKDDGHTFTESELHMVNADGTGRRQITSTPEKIEMNPSFSPDGRNITFDEVTEGAIYILKID